MPRCACVAWPCSQVMNAKMRTPMHSMTALSSLLAESELSDEQRSMAETVAFSSTLLASLLYDILEFWRLEEDTMKLKMQPEQFELPALVTEAETLSSPIARDKGLLVTFKPDPNLPDSVVGDGATASCKCCSMWCVVLSPLPVSL